MDEMKFIEATIAWTKGEIAEALITSAFGVLLIIFALCLWKFASYQSAHALVMPLVCVGLILGLSGGYNAYSNQNKIAQFEQRWAENSQDFLQSEKERVEGFQYLYTFTKYLAAILFAIAILIFFFVQNKHWQAIAIAFVILGLSGLVIDYFSKERADAYYEIIMKQSF